MRITSVEAWLTTMPLAVPYTAAYDVVETASSVFLRLTTDRRIVGFGCAAPDEHDTGETPDTILETIQKVVEPLAKGADPLRPAVLREQLRSILRDEASIRAAVDMALLDILGKKCEMPLWRLLGGYRDRIATSVTVGILPERETIAQARDWVRQGFRILKLKGGLDVEGDIARTCRVREAVGPEVALRFDANEGYSADEAMRFIDETRELGLELLEQPVRKSDLEQLGRVTRRGGVPIMADESLLTVRDAFRLASHDAVDGLNVKLMKVGGIGEAMEISAVARAARLEVMVGCLDESALGIAAALQYALADRNVAYADLDGHLALKDDPAAGAVEIQDGMLVGRNAPGLGVDQLDR